MVEETRFNGFPAGQTRITPFPEEFFTDLLGRIDHLGEIKLTLYAFWSLSKKEGTFRYLTLEEMEGDSRLGEWLSSSQWVEQDPLQTALQAALERGTFLEVRLELSQGTGRLYFLNTAKGRAAVEAIEAGDWKPTGDPIQPLQVIPDRPNIYKLYEENIGVLTPMIADRLREAEESYPASWIEEAIGIAVENNVRKWSYVAAILEDWWTRGKDEREDRGDTEKARRKYLEGELGDAIEP